MTLLTLPRSSYIAGCSGAYFHSPSTINLYCKRAGKPGGWERECHSALSFGPFPEQAHAEAARARFVRSEEPRAAGRANLVDARLEELNHGEVLAVAVKRLRSR